MQQILTNLDELFKPPPTSSREPVTPGNPPTTIEAQAQAEQARVAQILADQAKAEAVQDKDQGLSLVIGERKNKDESSSSPEHKPDLSEGQTADEGVPKLSELAAEAHAESSPGNLFVI